MESSPSPPIPPSLLSLCFSSLICFHHKSKPLEPQGKQESREAGEVLHKQLDSKLEKKRRKQDRRKRRELQREKETVHFAAELHYSPPPPHIHSFDTSFQAEESDMLEFSDSEQLADESLRLFHSPPAKRNFPQRSRSKNFSVDKSQQWKVTTAEERKLQANRRQWRKIFPTFADFFITEFSCCFELESSIAANRQGHMYLCGNNLFFYSSLLTTKIIIPWQDIHEISRCGSKKASGTDSSAPLKYTHEAKRWMFITSTHEFVFFGFSKKCKQIIFMIWNFTQHQKLKLLENIGAEKNVPDLLSSEFTLNFESTTEFFMQFFGENTGFSKKLEEIQRANAEIQKQEEEEQEEYIGVVHNNPSNSITDNGLELNQPTDLDDSDLPDSLDLEEREGLKESVISTMLLTDLLAENINQEKFFQLFPWLPFNEHRLIFETNAKLYSVDHCFFGTLYISAKFLCYQSNSSNYDENTSDSDEMSEKYVSLVFSFRDVKEAHLLESKSLWIKLQNHQFVFGFDTTEKMKDCLDLLNQNVVGKEIEEKLFNQSKADIEQKLRMQEYTPKQNDRDDELQEETPKQNDSDDQLIDPILNPLPPLPQTPNSTSSLLEQHKCKEVEEYENRESEEEGKVDGKGKEKHSSPFFPLSFNSLSFHEGDWNELLEMSVNWSTMIKRTTPLLHAIYNSPLPNHRRGQLW
eukprot:CAMPEP_0174251404 /NCGR_PEP_ID=MMETSP0439-20130205/1233_1 /TAXON_ID=0 /ORGANISM="Stereomyxa ramosa, Strain Chinc5" /LENGTH=691 /DNA_ID=CAMNT_0015331703 /DNA_START=13 /DNA_END=2085 /DNA_ORIENTATION=+